MPLVGSLVFPHGTMMFDGGEGRTATATERILNLPEALKEDCKSLLTASYEAAELAKAIKPEVIFMSTPHGLSLSKSLCVYLNPTGKGNCEWKFGMWAEYEANVNLDSELAKQFLEHLQKDGVPSEGLVAYNPACEAPLRWAEVTPLWFLKDLTASGVKVVLYSDPLTRHDPIPSTEAFKVGRSVSNFLNGLKQRVLYVISGNLAHTHQTDCALPGYLPANGWNFPTSDTALPFDISIENWVKGTPYSPETIEASIKGPIKSKKKKLVTWDSTSCQNGEKWLSRAFDLKQTALSCGIYGYALLHGILSAKLDENASIEACHFCRLAPTYFGMEVAAFIVNDLVPQGLFPQRTEYR